MVSQFQGMVLEEKSPANRPSFAEVRRRNNEVCLRVRFAPPENLGGSPFSGGSVPAFTQTHSVRYLGRLLTRR